MVKATQLKDYKIRVSNELDNLIKTNNFNKFADELQRICGVFTLNEFSIEDEFINAIKSNQLPTYGDTWEVRVYGKAYYVDWTAETLKSKEITVACGKKVKINYVVCNEAYDSQVPDAYVDYLKNNINKQITLFINREELRTIACGPDTFDALVNLIRSKINEATYDLLYDTLMCEINDPLNYKQIIEIAYCCDRCDGKSLLGALNTFALKLQRNTSEYNIQGRDYTLPVKDMFFLKSYDFDSKMMGILANTNHQDLVNIQGRFNANYVLDLNIADVILCDRRWAQMQETLNEVDWKYNIYRRGNCGVGNYVGRLKFINFLMAVPVKFVKVDCGLTKEAENVRVKIEAIVDPISANTEDEAKTAIDPLLQATKESGSTLIITATYSDFVAPTDQADGSINANVLIKASDGTVLEDFVQPFVLKKK